MNDHPQEPSAEELLEDSKKLSAEAHQGWQRLPYEDAGHPGLAQTPDAAEAAPDEHRRGD